MICNMRMISNMTNRTLAVLQRASRQSFAERVRLGVGIFAAISLSSSSMAYAEPVKVAETSLGVGDETRILRHLGLRVGPDDDYIEVHFGPGEGGDFKEGFLNYGKGKVADSKYLGIFPAGAMQSWLAAARADSSAHLSGGNPVAI
jgi:hypothetical protein